MHAGSPLDMSLHVCHHDDATLPHRARDVFLHKRFPPHSPIPGLNMLLKTEYFKSTFSTKGGLHGGLPVVTRKGPEPTRMGLPILFISGVGCRSTVDRAVSDRLLVPGSPP
ncbi:hypothetical protein KC19_2G008400 [Ceratodon purpureus]|uniref:Uncharacterized protein n=1 Tax=Ceratodon purpureus TaxID=3225 RepID=A0A8T0IRW4_CERPU|nr:hypothetical protein KC19_2G008400 [Ceratodon purpureus]